MDKTKKIFITVSVVFFVLLACAIVLFIYPNTPDRSTFLHIPKNSTFEQVTDSMVHNKVVKNRFTFKVASRLLGYRVLPGKYTIDPRQSNLKLILTLKKGQHYPVKFTFNNIRTKDKFLEKVGYKFLFDPQELDLLLNDRAFLAQYGFDPENVIGMFIPDTYEFYYDISAEEFFEKMHGYYERFWNGERLSEAATIGLTPMEVTILASIVEEENHLEDEKPMIAGLYINRLNRGMKLQADPTVKFALGNFALKRIYHKDTEVDSPYNTYKYAGLPPGPIRIPEKSTVDAVLNYTRHDFIFMCAKEDLSGRHNFAKTDVEHMRNAQRYHQALNKRQIRE